MSFCSRNHQKILQIPRVRRRRRIGARTGRRASLGVFAKGSLTLEASLVLPFLLCAVTALLYIFAFTSMQAKANRTLMERAQTLAITIGQGYGTDPYVRLYGGGTAALPFSAMSFGRRMTADQVVVRAWVGYTWESFSHPAGEEIVYITPGGSVYHRDRDCSHLRLSVRQISQDELDGERNQSGGRYYSCEYCVRSGENGGTVYITDHGGSYHSNINCQGLKRTIEAVPLSQAGGRPCCSRCGR